MKKSTSAILFVFLVYGIFSCKDEKKNVVKRKINYEDSIVKIDNKFADSIEKNETNKRKIRRKRYYQGNYQAIKRYYYDEYQKIYQKTVEYKDFYENFKANNLLNNYFSSNCSFVNPSVYIKKNKVTYGGTYDLQLFYSELRKMSIEDIKQEYHGICSEFDKKIIMNTFHFIHTFDRSSKNLLKTFENYKKYIYIYLDTDNDLKEKVSGFFNKLLLCHDELNQRNIYDHFNKYTILLDVSELREHIEEGRIKRDNYDSYYLSPYRVSQSFGDNKIFSYNSNPQSLYHPITENLPSFWYRRYLEDNIETTYQILKEIKEYCEKK